MKQYNEALDVLAMDDISSEPGWEYSAQIGVEFEGERPPDADETASQKCLGGHACAKVHSFTFVSS
jgi:hypothetical protein